MLGFSAATVFIVCALSFVPGAVSVPACDFFKVEGGYLESHGVYGGNLKCSPYPSLKAAKEECLSMVGCDGFSFGPWGSGLGGCLKSNREGGFKRNPKYVGYHKTLMGCCGDDRIERGQCSVREKRVEKTISRGKPATQCSTYADKTGPYSASRALDGNKDNYSITQKTLNPWWAVDLLKTYDITRIEITNINLDCCWQRLSNFMITVGDNPLPGSGSACLIGGTMSKGETKSFPCVLRGRFVTIMVVKPSEHLNLNEVDVFAMVPMTDEDGGGGTVV